MRTEMPIRVNLRQSQGGGRWAVSAWEAVSVVLEPDCGGSTGTPMTLALHRKETEGYRTNLAGERAVYVILRPDASGVMRQPFLATVCPFEAQDYADDADSRVDAVPMPELVAAWLIAFVRRHHVDEPFRKRERGPRVEREAFARPPRVKG